MKIKILKSSGWYKNNVGSEFEIDEYDIYENRLRFKVNNQGWIYIFDCVITELPESFYVKRCNDKNKWKKYIKWLNKTYNKEYYDNVGSYYGCDGGGCWSLATPIGTEIHIDDMIKHIEYMESQQHINGGEQLPTLPFYKEPQLTIKMETQKLSRKGLKEIHSVACPTWKTNLENYSKRNTLEDYIVLTNIEVDHMFNSCTKEQLPIVSKYLKQDDGSINFDNILGDGYKLNERQLIGKRTYGQYKSKSFYLDNKFDWKIQKDEYGELCLIPTKKK